MSKDSAMFSDVSCTGSVYHSVCELSSSRTSPTGDSIIWVLKDMTGNLKKDDFYIYYHLSDQRNKCFLETSVTNPTTETEVGVVSSYMNSCKSK